MRERFEKISEHMKKFGCALMGKAVYEATFMENFHSAHDAALVTAAHGAEIIIKACIAAEHPLLIFENISKINFNNDYLEEVLEKGKTIRYKDLPDLLQLTTGYEIKKRKEFYNFGKLRNQIIHLGVGGGSYDTIQFAIEIIEPLINKFWRMTIFEEVCSHDSEAKYYLIEQCVEAKKSGQLDFKISDVALEGFDESSKKYLMQDFQINLDDYV